MFAAVGLLRHLYAVAQRWKVRAIEVRDRTFLGSFPAQSDRHFRYPVMCVLTKPSC
jgi:hypothetical protein